MKRNNSENDWNNLIPLFTQDNKPGSTTEAIFELVTNGVSTKMDEWFFDFNENTLLEKVSFLIDWFNNQKNKGDVSERKIPMTDFAASKIKFTTELEDKFQKRSELKLIS